MMNEQRVDGIEICITNCAAQLYITSHQYDIYIYIHTHISHIRVCVCGNLWHQYAAHLVQASSKRPSQSHCLLHHCPIPLA